MGKQNLVLAIVALVLLSSCSGIKVIPLHEANQHFIENDVIVYALPKNIIRVEADANKHHHHTGPFAPYANELLGMPDVPLRDSTWYSLENITIHIFAEPDSEQFYLIDAGKKNKLPSIRLNDQGILQSYNAKATELKQDVPKSKSILLNQPNHQTDFIPLTQGQYLKNDTVYRLIETDSTTLRVPVVNKEYVTKTNRDKAQDLAKIMLEMREEKFAMLIGDLEEFPEGETFRTIMKEFDKLEDSYLPLFTGETSRTKLAVQKDITPLTIDQQNIQLYPIFAFSQEDGFLPIEEAEFEEIVYLQITPTTEVKKLESFYHQLDSTLATDKGLVYRIPEMVNVEIIQNKKVILHGRTPLAQHGTLARVPVEALNDKRIFIEFDTYWGNIIQINRSNWHRRP